MKKNDILKAISSCLLFIFLLLIKSYLYHILGIDINNFSKTFNITFNILYISAAGLISISFYISLHKQKQMGKYISKFIRGIIAFSLYFLLSELQLVPLSLSGVNYNNIPIAIKTIYLLSYELFMISVIGLV